MQKADFCGCLGSHGVGGADFPRLQFPGERRLFEAGFEGVTFERCLCEAGFEGVNKVLQDIVLGISVSDQQKENLTSQERNHSHHSC